jgi:hypothetical protein
MNSNIPSPGTSVKSSSSVRSSVSSSSAPVKRSNSLVNSAENSSHKKVKTLKNNQTKEKEKKNIPPSAVPSSSSSSSAPSSKAVESNELDDLFASLKQKVPVSPASSSSGDDSLDDWPEDDFGFTRSSNLTSSNSYNGPVKMYQIEELNMGKGGDTELCPFDCDCCY